MEQTSEEHREEEFGELTVEVKVVEPLGRETLVRTGFPDTSVILNVQTATNVLPQRGDRLSLELNLDKLFVFDSATGDKLYPY